MLIFRDYRGEINPSAIEHFIPALHDLEREETLAEPAPVLLLYSKDGLTDKNDEQIQNNKLYPKDGLNHVFLFVKHAGLYCTLYLISFLLTEYIYESYGNLSNLT